MQIHVVLRRPVYLHNKCEFKFHYYIASVQNALFFIHTGLKSLTPIVNSISSTMRCDKLCRVSIKHCLRSVTIHTILHHAPFDSQQD